MEGSVSAFRFGFGAVGPVYRRRSEAAGVLELSRQALVRHKQRLGWEVFVKTRPPSLLELPAQGGGRRILVRGKPRLLQPIYCHHGGLRSQRERENSRRKRAAGCARRSAPVVGEDGLRKSLAVPAFRPPVYHITTQPCTNVQIKRNVRRLRSASFSDVSWQRRGRQVAPLRKGLDCVSACMQPWRVGAKAAALVFSLFTLIALALVPSYLRTQVCNIWEGTLSFSFFEEKV